MGRPSTAVSEAQTRIAAVPSYSAFSAGSGFDLYSQFLPELYGVDLVRDMAVMADTDETVGAMLYCINTTMRQIDWTFVPQVDGVDQPDDPEAKKWADFMVQVVQDMNRPLTDHVDDAMTMLWAGFAPVEMITKRRDGVKSRFDDGLYGLRTLNLIDQTTIWDFVYDDDEVVAMRQMGFGVQPQGGLRQPIPTAKCLIYRTSSQYNNPRGRALLKSAWRAWRLKRKIQDSEALGIERELCGLPVFEMPEEIIAQQFEVDSTGVPTEDAKRARQMVAAARSAVTDLRLNKSGGLVIPSNTYADDVAGDTTRKYQFRIQTTGGQRAIDARTAARDYDHAIARVAMMQFLTLGQRSGGSYALADDQSSMAVTAISAIAGIIVAEFNQKAVPWLWLVNSLPSKYRPRLKHSDINKNTIVQLGQFLSGIGKGSELWAGDVKMREGLAKAADLPFDHEAQVEAANSAALMATQPPAPGAAPPGQDQQD